MKYPLGRQNLGAGGFISGEVGGNEFLLSLLLLCMVKGKKNQI